jgi:hypothetical protein
MIHTTFIYHTRTSAVQHGLANTIIFYTLYQHEFLVSTGQRTKSGEDSSLQDTATYKAVVTKR